MKTILLLLMCGLICVTGCEDKNENDSSDSNKDAVVKVQTITVSSKVIRINLDGTQLELQNGFTLILEGAELQKQRESCSGFEKSGTSEIGWGRTEYTYINDAEHVDYAKHIIHPQLIRFWGVNCEGTVNDPSDDVQYRLDSDMDGYTDNIDAQPNNPNVH